MRRPERGMRSFPALCGLVLLAALGACGPLEEDAEAAQADAAVAELRVEGMDCAGCVIGVRTALTRLEGVHSARVEYPSGTARVSFAPEAIAPAAFVTAIKRLGYDAVVTAVIGWPEAGETGRSGRSGNFNE